MTIREDVKRLREMIAKLGTDNPEALKVYMETSDLAERIELAMLMSAQVGDVAIPTIYRIQKCEAKTKMPYIAGVIDTETVYNGIDEWSKEINYNGIGVELPDLKFE